MSVTTIVQGEYVNDVTLLNSYVIDQDYWQVTFELY